MADIFGTGYYQAAQKAYATKPKKVKPKKVVATTTVLPTRDDILSQAKALVADLFKPQEDLLTSAYNTRNTNLAAAYDALAKMAAGIAPATAQTYKDAGQLQAGFAQGFTGAAREAALRETGAVNQALANLGSPQQVSSGLANGGLDATYATGGYIPASTFAQQGAAFTTANQRLPFTASKLGLEAQQTAGNEYLDSIEKLAAQQPDLLQKVYAMLQTDQVNTAKLAQADYQAKWKQWDANRKFALSKYQTTLNAQIAAGKLNLAKAQEMFDQQQQLWENANPEPKPYTFRTLANGQIQAYDPVTAQPVGAPSGPPKTPKPPAGKPSPEKVKADRNKALDAISGQPPEAKTFIGVGDNGTVKKARRTREQTIRYLTRMYHARLRRYNVKRSVIAARVKEMVAAMPDDWFRSVSTIERIGDVVAGATGGVNKAVPADGGTSSTGNPWAP